MLRRNNRGPSVPTLRRIPKPPRKSSQSQLDLRPRNTSKNINHRQNIPSRLRHHRPRRIADRTPKRPTRIRQNRPPSQMPSFFPNPLISLALQTLAKNHRPRNQRPIVNSVRPTGLQRSKIPATPHVQTPITPLPPRPPPQKRLR